MKTHLMFKSMLNIIVFALVTLLAVACSSQANPLSPSPSGVPEGTYFAKGDPGVSGDPDLNLRFSSGRFSINLPDQSVWMEGPYTSNKNMLVVLGDGKGAEQCNDTDDPGIYKWAINGSQLTLTKVQDTCLNRWDPLTRHPFTKK